MVSAVGRRATMLQARLVITGFLAAVIVATVTSIRPLAAADAIQKQDTNEAGVVAELIECKRADGVLTIRVVLRNTTDELAELHAIQNRNFDSWYATAQNKKYFILRDSEKTPLAPQADGSGSVRPRIAKGGSWTWWAKYPAPPGEVKKISYFTPLTAPFDDVPIAD
jgi:hypothetical protein